MAKHHHCTIKNPIHIRLGKWQASSPYRPSKKLKSFIKLKKILYSNSFTRLRFYNCLLKLKKSSDCKLLQEWSGLLSNWIDKWTTLGGPLKLKLKFFWVVHPKKFLIESLGKFFFVKIYNSSGKDIIDRCTRT